MPEVQNQEIVYVDRFSEKGKAYARGNKLHVIGALPGEEVVVEPFKKRQKFVFAKEVINPSSDRIEPFCSHVPECGGCAFQQLRYEAQLQIKNERIQNVFEGLCEDIRPILPCLDPFRYRNKMEFSFSEDKEKNRFLGLMQKEGRGRVINLKECHLVSKWFSQTLQAVRTWWAKSDLSAYHHYTDSGHLRTLTLREAKKGKMVMLTVSGRAEFALKRSHLKSFVEAVKPLASHLSIFLQVQQIAKGRPTQFFEMLLDGPDHITEVLEVCGQEMEFKISPTSFFQPNSRQAEKLYTEGLNLLGDLTNSRVFDLYCGGATIGLSCAKRAKEVVGIEINPHSVFDATWNQEVNGVENFSIEKGDVGEVLERLKQDPSFKPPDVVIVDPPRAGLDNRALQHVMGFKAKEILYISCNPRTQVENIKELISSGYMPKTIQPVDQFPHTMHIENIAHLIFDPS